MLRTGLRPRKGMGPSLRNKFARQRCPAQEPRFWPPGSASDRTPPQCTQPARFQSSGTISYLHARRYLINVSGQPRRCNVSTGLTPTNGATNGRGYTIRGIRTRQAGHRPTAQRLRRQRVGARLRLFRGGVGTRRPSCSRATRSHRLQHRQAAGAAARRWPPTLDRPDRGGSLFRRWIVVVFGVVVAIAYFATRKRIAP